MYGYFQVLGNAYKIILHNRDVIARYYIYDNSHICQHTMKAIKGNKTYNYYYE